MTVKDLRVLLEGKSENLEIFVMGSGWFPEPAGIARVEVVHEWTPTYANGTPYKENMFSEGPDKDGRGKEVFFIS